ncbi:MAG: transglutaminase-like domain-containing protein [Archaeoglobaceae archaeon]
MLRFVALAMLIIAISLLTSFLSSLDFSFTGFEGLIGAVNDSGSATTGDFYANVSLEELLNLTSEPFNPPNVPIFFVEGVDVTTNYLRLFTASRYNGSWIVDAGGCDFERLAIAKKYKITPIVELRNFLPVAKDTVAIRPLKDLQRCYDAESGTYRVNSTSTPYYGFSTAKKVEPTKFAGSTVYEDSELEALARSITANASGDYEKAKAIERYLRENYVNAYAENEDVKQFLFETKRGTSEDFATAFVLLAQSIGIPARLVFGFVAEPFPRNQTIFASDAHFWAEVKFEEGWVEFDPTPSGAERMGTRTEITHVDSKLVAGENFRLEGFVIDENGRGCRRIRRNILQEGQEQRRSSRRASTR